MTGHEKAIWDNISDFIRHMRATQSVGGVKVEIIDDEGKYYIEEWTNNGRHRISNIR